MSIVDILFYTVTSISHFTLYTYIKSTNFKVKIIMNIVKKMIEGLAHQNNVHARVNEISDSF